MSCCKTNVSVSKREEEISLAKFRCMDEEMEDCDNIFQRQAIVSSKTKVGKPPTRLQKHAPATLELDRLCSGGLTNPLVASGNLTIIPLLSPLIASPQPLPEAEEFQFLKCGNMNEMSCDDIKDAGSVPGEYQHSETTTLLTSFQSKCVLVNDV